MKKVVPFLHLRLITLVINTLLIASFSNVGFTQAQMSLWYVPDDQRGSTPHHLNSVEIPCDWNYYHRYDGKDKIIEYGIRNDGNAPLTLNLPLAFEASSSFEFSILEQPTKATLQPGEDIHFKIKYRNLGIYRSAKAILPINSDDATRSVCTLNFRIGGGPPFPNPLENVNCFEKIIRQFDFEANNMIDETQTTTRVLDANNNILQETDVEEDDLGVIIGERIITNTYNDQNQVVTFKQVNSGIYKSFTCDEMYTNTYDGNDLLIKQIFQAQTIAGLSETTFIITYDGNNRLLKEVVTYQNPFGSGVVQIDYTYDVNGNLLTIIQDQPGVYSYSMTNTYDTNNNLLTSIEVENGLTIYTLTNTYDTNNNLLTSAETIDGDPPFTTTYTYDANNNLLTSTEIIDEPFGTITTTTVYTYNNFNHIITQSFTFTINAPPLSFGFGLSSLFTYDSFNRLTNIVSDPTFINIPAPPSRETYTITPCGLPELSIADPCNCADPLNIKNIPQDIITHFHDVLSVTGTPGDVVILQTGNTDFLNSSLTQIPDGTNLGMIPTSGELTYDFFHASGTSGAITLNVGGVLANPFDISVCSAKSCIIIPTMSQWGLLIFGLLILNIGLFFVQQLKYIR